LCCSPPYHPEYGTVLGYLAIMLRVSAFMEAGGQRPQIIAEENFMIDFLKSGTGSPSSPFVIDLIRPSFQTSF